MAQEVEFRLEQSYQLDEAFGGTEIRPVLKLIAAAAAIVDSKGGKSWLWDSSAYDEFVEAVASILPAFRPKLVEGASEKKEIALSEFERRNGRYVAAKALQGYVDHLKGEGDVERDLRDAEAMLESKHGKK